MKAKEYLAPAVVLTVICAVISFLLGLTNEATKDRIAENEIKAANAARIEVLPGAQDFEDVTFFIDNPDYEGYSLYRETSGLGYAVTTKAKGYGGDITVVTGISAEGKVTGVYTLNSSETPGLGKKTEDEAFTEQYLADRQGSQFQVVKNTAKGPGEVVAVAGATISSKAVTQAVNQAVEIYALYAYSRDTM